MYQVKEVAELSGISVRTLHHYDKIGLLKPSKVAKNGYRYYDDDNLAQLQHILFFKELDFSLKQIKDIMTDNDFDERDTLMKHRELLEKKIHRLEKLIKTIDETFASMKEGGSMNQKKMFENFSMEDIENHKTKYAKETKEKYGHTDAYKQSQQRTANYTEEDWKSISEQSHEIYNRLASLMNHSPEEDEVQKAIGQWYQLINDNFYECSPEMFSGLGDMYVNDPRFTKNINQYGEGLAQFMRDAMHIFSNNMANK
ncbi:MerR family transcriptional regulator [Tenuibacillus multivorans]|uniref:DNA-binding transcriptional regulator, MerR family n=1 Tax=Tenuibacillus multivorans TaxID=237069 RepID=A0A1H0B0W9_9BACI|nr:MerR family transcriptional regulator [Tenuibacillus multivorans]GEL77576.1 MerR family transcriptional regulator [Tenuibacillus multivorans]SDN39310.1 DNA-binding transcriptional regulator, MerR family [Tenuibacillus multivorans]